MLRLATLALPILALLGALLILPQHVGGDDLPTATTLVAETNAARAASGLAPLAEDATLDHLAAWRAHDMANTLEISHCWRFGEVLPCPHGYALSQRYSTTLSISEVVLQRGVGDLSPPTAMFLGEPEHQAVLLRKDATAMGAASARGTDGSLIVAEEIM